MTTLNLPTLLTRGNATECQMSLQANTQFFESPLNKTVQTYELPGAKWLLTATWQNLCEADLRIFKAWMASLRGMAGRFYAGDLSYKRPRGCVTGAGKAYAAKSAGYNTLSTLWSLISTSNILLPGDYFQIGTELKIITEAASTNSLGLANLTFEPPLRSDVDIDDAIIISSPVAIFRLNDDQQDQINIDPDRHQSITIAATEVFS